MSTAQPLPASSAQGNIGPRAQRQRAWLGVITLLVALALGCFFVWAEVNPLIRWTVFVPFFFAYLGLFQAKAKTCVFLVARGECDLDAGRQPVTDPLLQANLKRRAQWIYLKTTVAAFLWSFLFFVYEKDWWRSLQEVPVGPAAVIQAVPQAAPASMPTKPTHSPANTSPTQLASPKRE